MPTLEFIKDDTKCDRTKHLAFAKPNVHVPRRLLLESAAGLVTGSIDCPRRIEWISSPKYRIFKMVDHKKNSSRFIFNLYGEYR